MFNKICGFLRMLKPKVFAGGCTTLPKPVREALGVKASDTVRFLVSDNDVHIEQAQSVPETADMLVRSSQS